MTDGPALTLVPKLPDRREDYDRLHTALDYLLEILPVVTARSSGLDLQQWAERTIRLLDDCGYDVPKDAA
jgi:hypothetical protein